jgi:hypothetical protein
MDAVLTGDHGALNRAWTYGEISAKGQLRAIHGQERDPSEPLCHRLVSSL